MFLFRKKTEMPSESTALKGRDEAIPTAETHFVLDRPIKGPFPQGLEAVYLGMGCFWGAERKLWQLGPGIWTTAVGYAGGLTPNATYDELCTGRTGHAEVVLVVFDPKVMPFSEILKVFWESHDPTQGMQQGNDVGTQYRSVIYTTTEAQLQEATGSRDRYQAALRRAGLGEITTEIRPAPTFYYAEEYHQQYLAKVPHGYCGLRGTGVSCPIGAGVAAAG